MAEKLAVHTPPLDKILVCSLCDKQLKIPHKLQQCLHSFCKLCIDSVPKETRDDQQGCSCPQCKTFSSVEEIQPDTFIGELLNLHNAPTGTDVAEAVCVQCGSHEEVTGQCEDCKIELCGKCQIYHLKIPMCRSHKIVPKEDESSKVIDRIIFCPVHEDEIIKLNCETCNKVICLCCIATGNEHEGHKTEFVTHALDRMIPRMKTNADNISDNINNIKAQIEGVKCKIEEVKECYASCRLDMDDHLEKVISRLRAMKAKVEDDVTEQESIALDTLDGIKQNLENQLSQVTNVINIVAAANDCYRNVSLLTAMHGGLYTKINTLGGQEQHCIDVQIPDVTFAKSEDITAFFAEVFGDVNYKLESLVLDPSGKIFQLKHMCESFVDFFNNTFKEDSTIELPALASKLSYIGEEIWIPLCLSKSISIYNQHGELVKSVDTGEKKVVVVKRAHNGDIIAGGADGLYVVSNDWSEWSQISGGTFSDIVLHKNTLSALDSSRKQILTFSYSTSNNMWTEIQNITIENMKQFNLLDTISSSGDSFIVSDIAGRNIIIYGKDGDVIKSKSSPPLFLTGTDKRGQVLMTNFDKGTLHILDINNEELSFPCIGDLQCPELRDVIIDGEKNVWCLKGNKTIFTVVKFVMNK